MRPTLLWLLNPIPLIGSFIMEGIRHCRWRTPPKFVLSILLTIGILNPTWAIPTVTINPIPPVETDVTQVMVTGIATAVGGGQGIDLMLVLDDSSSLSGSDPDNKRFDAVRELLTNVASNPNVNIGLVFFNSRASLEVPLGPLSTVEEPIRAELDVRQVQGPRGFTGIGRGIRTATDEFFINGRQEASQIILLFTDGGETESSNPDGAALSALDNGITVNVVGLGQGDNQSNQAIAQAGGGQFFPTTDASQLSTLFTSGGIVGMTDTVIVSNKTTNQQTEVNLSAGVFNVLVDLILGENVIEVTATDLNGLSETLSITAIRKRQFTIALSPDNATNIAGTTHTITAIVTDESGNLVSQRELSFGVTQGPNASVSETTRTDDNGSAPFTYSLGNCAGVDEVQAWLFDSSRPDPFFSNSVFSTIQPTPPTANFITTPNEAYITQEIQLNGSSSAPACGVESINDYQWQSSDGQPIAPGVNSSIVYSQPGDYQITLTVTDNLGGTQNTQKSITVLESPPPIAGFIATPLSGYTPLTVNLDGSSSAASYSGGSIANYQWQSSDGQPIASVVNSSITYTQPGDYAVTLVVTDERGGTANSSPQTITVSPLPSNEEALRIYLEQVDEVESVSIEGQDVSVVMSGQTHQGLLAEQVNPGPRPENFLDFNWTSDVNDDGIIDFDIVYPSGDQQFLYYLGATNTNLVTPAEPTGISTVASANDFIYTGPNPAQTGVAPGTIDPINGAIVRGKVINQKGLPLSGVTITMANRPEFGQTLTEPNGFFNLAVNAGAFTVNYQKAGYVPLQRRVQVAAQEYVRMDDVMMRPVDPAASIIKLGADAPPVVQVFESEVEIDQDGQRQAVGFIPPGTIATVEGTGEQLTNLTIRATEFTVGQHGLNAMPAPLPPTADYTYAIDLRVDEAGGRAVNLNRAIPIFVDNFLDFPVGTIVPVGFLSETQGQCGDTTSNWQAATNGRVIQIIGVDNNGRAMVDVDGSGQPASTQDLTDLGLSDPEILEDVANRYAPGDSSMTTQITQITAYDLNWDLLDPTKPNLPPGSGGSDNQTKNPCEKPGCIIEVENQVLGERIPIVGTPFSLNYRSNRVPANKDPYSFLIPLRNELTPVNVKRIKLQVSIAGKTIEQTFAADTPETRFVWDGTDAYGRSLQGRQKANIRIGYVYDGVYEVPQDIADAFCAGGNGISLGVPARQEVIGWLEYPKTFGAWYPQDLGGFTLDIHHAYDLTAKTLYRGDGGQRQVEPNTRNDNLIIPSNDGGLVYEFAGNGRHLQTVDSLTGQTLYAFNYDDNGYLINVVDVYGNSTTIERDGKKPLAIIAPEGQRTALSVNEQGYLSAITNPASEAHLFVYSPEGNGLLIQHFNPKGLLSTYTYDAAGKLIQDVNPANGGWQLNRAGDATNYTTTLTSAEGRISRFKVGTLADGSLQRVNTAPDGTSVQTIEYEDKDETYSLSSDGMMTILKESPDPRFGEQSPILESLMVLTPSGLTSTITTDRQITLANPNDPLSLITQVDKVTVNGQTSVSAYDTVSNTITETSPMGRQTMTYFDNQGNVIKEQVPGLADVDYQYDEQGRLKVIAEGWKLEDNGESARITLLNYGEDGYLSSLIDPLGQQTQLSYDGAGRIIFEKRSDGREIYYSYDANGNVTSIIPPERPAHQFDYTPVDLQAQYAPPVLTEVPTPQTQYDYNLDKQPTKITRPDGQAIEFEYDDGGRLARLNLPHGQQSYRYNDAGNIETITASDGSTLSYGYDGSLPLFEIWSNGPVNGTLVNSYDNDFRVVSTDVNGQVITYQYDADSLLQRVGDLWLTRDVQNGLLTGTTLYPIDTQRTYNAFGEITDVTATFADNPRYNTQYRYDKLGRITQKVETIEGLTTTYGYQYDAAGRLAEVTEDGIITHQYAYDGNGNRTWANTPDGAVNGNYDEQDRLLQYGATTYTYTANGDLLTKNDSGAITEYEYDVLGNLRSVQLPDGTLIEYVIDGRNRRIGKKVNGVLVQGLLYQGALNPVAELDANGNLITRFVYATKANVPDYMIKQGVIYRILSDHLGSPRLVINTADGTVAQQLDYDVFGNVIFDSNPGFQPFGFAGGIYDVDTGLVRFGARGYDAEIGRWTAKDPITFASGDTNLYGYVLNDPINIFDSTGLRQIFIGGDVDLKLGAGASLGGGLVADHEGNVGIKACAGVGVGAGAFVGGGVDFQAGTLTEGYTATGGAEASAQAASVFGAGVSADLISVSRTTDICGVTGDIQFGGVGTSIVQGIMGNKKAGETAVNSLAGGVRFGMGATAGISGKACHSVVINPGRIINNFFNGLNRALNRS